MKSEGPVGVGGKVMSTAFAKEIMDSDGEWVETDVFRHSKDNQYVFARIGHIVAEVHFKDGIMYGRKK